MPTDVGMTRVRARQLDFTAGWYYPVSLSDRARRCARRHAKRPRGRGNHVVAYDRFLTTRAFSLRNLSRHTRQVT
ncbi:MAG: hypothetical protein ABSC06_20700 [Rhodopila sp.]|jgi:hypothetical protein